MSEKYSVHKHIDDDGYNVIKEDSPDCGSCITATPEEIYHALLDKRREVVVGIKAIKVMLNPNLSNTLLCDPNCGYYREVHKYPYCRRNWGDDGVPTDKCPPPGEYELILRKKGE